MTSRLRHRHLAVLVLCASSFTATPKLRAQQRTPAPHSMRGASAILDSAAILATARPEIDAANAAWLPGLRQRDAEAIVAAYADSGLFIAADGAVTRGRAAIAQLYVARFPRLREIRGGDVVQEGLAVVAQNLIYEWGHAWVEMVPATPGGAPVRSGGRYLTVWQRQTDGHWRIARNLTF